MFHSCVSQQVRTTPQHTQWMNTTGKFSWAAQMMCTPSAPGDQHTLDQAPSITTKHLKASQRQSHVTTQQAFEQGCWHELEERAKQLHPSNLITLWENLAYSEDPEIAGSFIKFVLCVEMLSARSDFSHYLNGDTTHREIWCLSNCHSGSNELC